MADGLPPPEVRTAMPSKRAFFELASGLICYDSDQADFWKTVKDGELGLPTDEYRALSSLLAHEVTHYFQFLGCGYVSLIGSWMFQALRRVAPSPFTEESVEAWLATPQPRPDWFERVYANLAQVGPGGFTPRELIEGAAFLAQAIHDRSDINNGAFLLLLENHPLGDFYGKLYRHLAFVFGDRAMRETLFLSQVALEFIDPHITIDRLIHARVRQIRSCDEDDLSRARSKLIAEVSNDDHLGSVSQLVTRETFDHPLLWSLTLYNREPEWDGAIRRALWGQRPMLMDFFSECEILFSNAVWFARVGDEEAHAERTRTIRSRVFFARMSMKFNLPLEHSDA